MGRMADLDLSVRELDNAEEKIATDEEEAVEESVQVVTSQGDVELHNPNFIEEDEEEAEEKDEETNLALDQQPDDDEEDEEDDDDDDVAAPPAEGSYDPSEYDLLPVDGEIKDLFTFIVKYTPQTIDLEHKFKPFVPEYIPAVGDIDAFIRCARPDQKQEKLGLTVLDEPSATQSDPSVLELQLRVVTKQSASKATRIKSVKAGEDSTAVEKWIRDISDLHRSKPPPSVHYQKTMPDIDGLMQDWPEDFEELLKTNSLPTADLAADLATQVDIVCGLLDIPRYKSRIQSLHVLFTLYSASKNSQHFNNLAMDNQMDNQLKIDDSAFDAL